MSLLSYFYSFFKKENKEEKPRKVRNALEERAAIHESGHAILALMSPHVATVERVTIDLPLRDEPHQIGDGHVYYRFYQESTSGLNWDRVAISLAGLAAEHIKFKKLSSKNGTAPDLQNAIDLARKVLVARPPWSASDSQSDTKFDITTFYKELTDREKRILRYSYHRARNVLIRNSKFLDALYLKLLEEGTLSDKQVKKIAKGLQ